MADNADVTSIHNSTYHKEKQQNISAQKVLDKMSEIDEHIAKRFEIKKRIGKGAYGIVWKAVDKKTKEVVAIKKIFDAFRNQTDAQRTFREIIFLQSFKNHPNIIKLHSIHRAANNRDIYLGFEYMTTDLHNVIKRGNILKDVHKRFIMYQMLKATKYIHSGNVIHRDQKPSNVLIDNACRVKIADFGLARSVSSCNGGAGEGGADPCLTDYVATRWYRAPEILIASRNYTKGIDMWSLGCILGEMLVGEPLFPGSSTVNQVERIMACIPPPSEEDIQAVCTGYGSSLVRTAVSRRTPLKEMLLRSGCREAVDLACRLLVFNPGRRPTAHQALQHAYVARFHQEKNEPVLLHNVIPPLCDDLRLSVDEYRNRLYGLMKRGSSRNAESSSDSASTTLERRQPTSVQTTRGYRPQAFTAAASVRHSKVAADNEKPNLSGLLAHYAHRPPTHVQSEPKMFSNIDVVSKPQKNTVEQKKIDKTSHSKPIKEERRNPLRKNLSIEEYIMNSRKEYNQDNGRSKCRGDFIRSMSDESYVKCRIKPPTRKSGSINNLYGKSIEEVERSAINKFSQKHGIITASALMELRSSIR